MAAQRTDRDIKREKKKEGHQRLIRIIIKVNGLARHNFMRYDTRDEEEIWSNVRPYNSPIIHAVKAEKTNFLRFSTLLLLLWAARLKL